MIRVRLDQGLRLLGPEDPGLTRNVAHGVGWPGDDDPDGAGLGERAASLPSASLKDVVGMERTVLQMRGLDEPPSFGPDTGPTVELWV